MVMHVIQHPVFFGDPARPAGAGATVTVTNASDGSAATCYSDRLGASAISNVVPVSNGVFRAYVPAGLYNLTASYQSKTAQLLDVEVGEWAVDAVSPYAPMGLTGGVEGPNATVTESGKRVTVSPTGESYAFSPEYANSFAKYYVEVEILAAQTPSVKNMLLYVGLAKAGNLTGSSVPDPLYGVLYHQGGNYYYGLDEVTENTGTNNFVAAGDILMMAVDFAEDKVWMGVNGDWGSGSDPSTGTLPAFEPGASFPRADIPAGAMDGNWHLFIGGYADGGNYQADLRILTPDNQVYTTPTGFNV